LIRLMKDNFGIRICTGKVFPCPLDYRLLFPVVVVAYTFPDHLGRDLNAPKRFYILIPLLLLPRKVYSNHAGKRLFKKKKLKHLSDSYRLFFSWP